MGTLFGPVLLHILGYWVFPFPPKPRQFPQGFPCIIYLHRKNYSAETTAVR
jgi:hypothetical protein